MKRGFTLIELLAVIVILAIIALIAVPIVLNIIQDSKESAILRSADFYLDGVETAIATSLLKNIQIADGTYPIMEDGNICLGILDEKGNCNIEPLKVEMDGEKPTSGTVKIRDGQIYKLDMTISDREVWTDLFTGNLEYKLASGLYDENDNLIASWDELMDKYDIKNVIESDHEFWGGNVITEILKNYDNETKLVIDKGVTSIGKYAFNSCNLTSIIIPEGVESIDEGAFISCSSLTGVTIPDSVTSIGLMAFDSCNSLKTITIPQNVISIDPFAFHGTELTSIKVDKNNIVYDSRDNSNAIIETSTNTLIIGFENTTIPNSVTNIGSGAFLDCIGLTSILIPESVTTIDEFAFDGCTNLKTIYYKGDLTYAPWGAPNNPDIITS